MSGRALRALGVLGLGFSLVVGCADSGGGGDADGAVGTDVAADAVADAETTLDAAPDAVPDAVPDVLPDALPDADAGPDADADIAVDADSQTDAVGDADAVADADAVSDADAVADADADAVPDADTVADVDVDAVSDADAAPDALPDAAPDATPDVLPDVVPDAVPDSDVALNPCAPTNPCTNPPATVCSENSVVTYPKVGVCTPDGATAKCEYPAATTTDCAPGFCTAGACVPWRLAGVGDLVITEIMHRPNAVFENLGEWFEVQSVATEPVNLAGLVVRDLGVDSFTIATDLVVAPGKFVVLGRDADSTKNGGLTVNYAYGTKMSLASGDELLIARDGVTIDLVDWDSKPGFPNKLGASLNLDPGKDAASNDLGASWCLSKSPYGAGDFGTPGKVNDSCALINAPCTPNPCLSPPTASCGGDVLTTFTSPGVCASAAAPAFFACTYPPKTADCALAGQRCEPTTGACVECVENSDCEAPFEVCGAAFTCVPGCQDDQYAGNSKENPKLIASNVQNVELVLCGGTEDWFGFDLPDATTLQVTVLAAPNGPPVGIEILDPSGDVVATGPSGSNHVTASYLATVGGVHLVRLHGGPNAYSLSVVFTDEVCVPSPCAAATPAPICDGSDRVTYTHLCDDTTGSAVCSYPEATRVTCANFCNDGECTDWRLVEAVGDLVISELMISPGNTADAVGEYIELHNTSTSLLNLDGLEVYDLGSEGFFIAGTLLVPADGRVVLGLSDELAVNGGVEVDYVYTGMTLDGPLDAVAIARAGVDVDDVIWDDVEFPSTGGAAMSLDPARGDELTNDYGVGWCLASSALSGGDFGTPGAPNDPCVIDFPIDTCRVHDPELLFGLPLALHVVTGRVFINGLTNINVTGNDPIPARVFGEVGFGDPGTDPATDASWSWFAGDPDVSYGVATPAFDSDEDQYVANLVAPAEDGDYDLAYRFTGNAGATWTYCDALGSSGDGTDPYDHGDAGLLSVETPPPPSLIISEYVDGSPGTGNKAVELTNVGTAPIDLAAAKCRLLYYATPNTGVGAHTQATFDVALAGTVAPGASWVLCQSAITIFPVAKCQQTSSSTAWFNGDDPVELRCGTDSIDWIGQTGFDLDFALDVTLTRSCRVREGDPIGTDAFSVSPDWQSFAQNYVVDLGRHEPEFPVLPGGAQELIIEAVDLQTQRLRLRNVTAVDVNVSSAWRLCKFPTYLAFTTATVTIPPDGSATFAIPPGLALTAGGSWELGVYRNSANFAAAANMVAYVEVNAAGFTREGVGTAAGVWTAGEFITLDGNEDAGFVVRSGETVSGPASYQTYGKGCSIR
ncbi:MAG: lamin tail domain-containing protein [Myxococcota bacterium]